MTPLQEAEYKKIEELRLKRLAEIEASKEKRPVWKPHQPPPSADACFGS